MFSNFFRTLLTGKNDASYDITRVMLLLCVVALIVYEGTSIYLLRQAFEPHMFAIACGALLFGGGSGIAIKASTEPEPDPK